MLILLLDKPVSAGDTGPEQRVSVALACLPHWHRTRTITRYLSMIRNIYRIFMRDHARAKGPGNHMKLRAAKAVCAYLQDSQSVGTACRFTLRQVDILIYSLKRFI
ncbi:hypothetical protein E2K80_00130 [Rhodophyticola sp. CCM32]|uniref:hypothetical protein n=1 Tax=Rhodophyticola sp. CCM32 TaxID=2916397 RepID=UPI00107F0D21|nr:hypothetical protein [Rhodophyticola sp. CCM32]QBX99337.1 hypothetical protein E2K80_00130 [Rhodophyticola sp. CCM32]